MEIPAKPRQKGRSMQKRQFATACLVCALLTLVFTVTAQASANRTYVSTHGNDANTAVNCSASANCRTFAAALSVTNPGGEIIVVNSGSYGPATISQPVSITAIGIVASILATSGNALTISTIGNVNLTGLSLDGHGAGTDGILVSEVGFLRLYNMSIQKFKNDGIEFDAASGNLAVYNSIVNDNGNDGLLFASSANAYVNGTSFDGNKSAGCESSTGNMTVVDSTAHINGIGFYAAGGTLSLDNDRVIFNGTGLEASSTGHLYFARCLVTNSTTDSYNVASGGVLSGTDPGTTLITPGQSSIGTPAAATPLN